ncbi:XRE family transcriptional regulator [Aggregicoccus sp. 17bor-14]|uniref:helix-turn-helix domain-containing protein n=1 Tax=Myxococcaceae TaxID=31 RepID=UPI00129C772D|nr:MULTISPECIES: helix-turn-helix transcriptional regulator [Myxococcaceae]MBF5045335.1 XRE family transcriptional regulator [Simulacricoccus sp. 17bor-14]MRI91077.1 XRE family transcriptional regulator [Aggregicoccus sp. 17bor-14]
MAKTRTDITRSSGNVFEDLDLPEAEETRTKADLVHAISKAIAARRLKRQQDVADLLGIDQPKVSKLLRGHFSEYSVERLMEFLTRLGMNVEIKVTPKRSRTPGHIHVVA